MTYLLHKHLQHWNEKFTMLHTFLWLPWGFCLHLMKTFLLPRQWQAVCERRRFLKRAYEKYVRIFLMWRVQLIARHLRIYKSWTCFQTQQKTLQLKIHIRKCSMYSIVRNCFPILCKGVSVVKMLIDISEHLAKSCENWNFSAQN